MRRANLLASLLAVVLMGLVGGRASTAAVWDPALVLNSTTVLVTGGGSVDWHGRASIKTRADGVQVMVYYSAEAHDTNVGALHIKFLPVGGAWTAADTKIGGGAVSGFPMNPTVSAGQDAGEPWLMVAPNGDLLLHMWRINYGVEMGGTYQSRSTDDGASWSTPVAVDFTGLSDDTIVFATDDHFVYDQVIYAGTRVYTGGADGTPSQSVLIKSADDGASWSLVSIIMDDDEGDSPNFGGQEVGLEYLGNSVIVAMIRENPHTKSYQRLSTDMGLTWGSLTDVTSTVGIAGRQRVYTRSHLMGVAGWWNDPVLLMNGFVHQVSGSSQTRRNAVWVGLYKASGPSITWTAPMYVDSSTEDAGYGDTFYYATDGLFHYVSYDGTLATAELKDYAFSLTGLVH